MTQQKKKNFGLAAQLVQPRSAPTPPDMEQPGADNAPAADRGTRLAVAEEPASAVFDDAAIERTERFDHTDHTKRSRRKEKKPGAPPREGGYVRRTITLAPTLSDYVDRAWRTYRRSDGKYVKGVSGFIEAVIDEHRRRSH